MADVTEHTVTWKELVTNKTERAVIAIGDTMTQCAAIWNLVFMQWNKLCMEELTTNITVAPVLGLPAEVTERGRLRLTTDETEYVVIGLAVETIGFGALKLDIDAIQ